MSSSLQQQPVKNYRRDKAASYIEAEYGIPCKPNTLAKYACAGTGPAFYMSGNIPLYPKLGLDAWAQERLGEPVRSTSEAKQRGAA